MQRAERAPVWSFGRFVWHDIVTPDVKRSRRFYAGLFGWRYQDLQMGPDSYPMILGPAGPLGGLMSTAQLGLPDTDGHVMAFLSVPDVDGAATAAKCCGGQVLSPAVEVPGVGRLAVLADPGGATFTVIHSAVGDAPVLRPRARTFAWEQLHTRASARTGQFYKEVVGWELTPAVKHQSLNADQGLFFEAVGAEPSAGLSGRLDAGQDRWLSYVMVTDLRAARAQVRRLGGRVLESIAAEGIGTLTVIEDDLGVRLGLLTTAAS